MTTDKPLNGGGLIIWLRLHRDEVIGYFESNGLTATLEKYNISQPTFERLVEGTGVYKNHKGLSKAERAYHMAEVAIASNSDLRREIRELKEAYGQLVELIAGKLTAKMIEGLRNIDINVPPELEYKDEDPLQLG